MKLWDKGFTINQQIESFTIGKDRELDMYLAKYDILASKAHAEMLSKQGLITVDENTQLQLSLNELLKQVEAETFVIEKEFEDVHSKIESYLILQCGEAGKKIHTARSRNDQVLVAIQLFQKEYLNDSIQKILQLIDILMINASKFKDKLLPGYTHFQAAMPNSFGLWFTAYAENLLTDLHFFKAAYKVSDQNPLGSGAGFGTSFNIDRKYTTELLDFSELAISSVGAQMLRGKTEKAVAVAISMVAATISKMSYDLVMYNSQDMGFIKLPNQMTTGSSIMPHKKNPDVFELTRAQCNKLQALPNNITLVTNNLPSGYHRDFQILKEILFESMIQFSNILDILIFAIPNLEIREDYMNQEKYDSIYTVENINSLIQSGTPFREAYKQVGLSVEDNSYKPLKEFTTKHVGSIHNLGLHELKEKIERFRQG